MSNKFRTWDSQALYDCVKLSSQISSKIEEICEGNNLTPSDLPDSLIPTSKLYMLAMAYNAAYESLIEYDLVKTGNIKQTKNTH